MFLAEFVFSIIKRMFFFRPFLLTFDLSTQLSLSLVSFSVGWLLTSEEVRITSALASQYVSV